MASILLCQDYFDILDANAVAVADAVADAVAYMESRPYNTPKAPRQRLNSTCDVISPQTHILALSTIYWRNLKDELGPFT